MQSYLIPPPLRPGDRVHVIAPAGAVPREAFETGLGILRAAGFVPVYDEALLGRERYFAGSHTRRQAELLRALEDTEARAVWAARGGYGTARLLAAVRPQLLRAQPKWLVGFSDLTGLHAAYQRAQMVSLHGANVTTLASWSEAARNEMFALLAEGHSYTESFVGKDASIAAAPALPAARLWGGNLTVLASLCGTGQLPDAAPGEACILLLEEIGEPPYRLDRSWHQLQASGALNNVVGVAIGQLSHCEAKGADYTGLEMLTQAIEAAHLPWVSGLPFGHANDARAVPLGAIAELDVQQRRLVVRL